MTKFSSLITRLFPLLTAFMAIVIFLLVAVSAVFGYEVTDEGYYLLLEGFPENYRFGTSAFGLIVNPIYVLFDGNFIVLRVLSSAAYFGLSIAFFFVILSSFEKGVRKKGFRVWAYSISFSVSIFTVYSTYIQTPNYNSLTLQTLILFGILVIQLINNSATNKTIIGLLLGSDLVLIAVNKPTTGIITLLVGLTIIFLFKFALKIKINLLSIFVGGISTTVLFVVWMQIFGINAFEFFQVGSNLQQTFNPRYSLINMLRTDFEFKWKELFPYSLLFTFALSMFSVSIGRVFQVFCTAAFIFNLFFVYKLLSQAGWNITQTPIFLYAFIGVCIYLCFSISLKKSAVPGIIPLTLAGFFFVLPWMYVFGTNNNYLVAEIQASIFWVAASLILLLSTEAPINRKQTPVLNVFLALISLIVILTLGYSFTNPYRQISPVSKQVSFSKIGKNNTPVLVPNEFADYVSELRLKAENADFTPGTPIIDLTGESPGTVYLMGGRSVYQPWLLGGYPGSLDFAQRVLKGAKCSELKESWVLYSDENFRHFDQSVLSTVNLSLEKDFELVAVIVLPSGYGSSPEGYKQYLYKPLQNRVIDLRNCSQK